MKKNILVFVILILNLSLYAQKIAQLNAVKMMALKELGYTTITADNAKEVFEKIAEIQSRKV